MNTSTVSRLGAGWVSSVMRERGIRLSSRETLQIGLDGLDEELSSVVSMAARRASQGFEISGDLELLSSISTACDAAVRDWLQTNGVAMTIEQITDLAVRHRDWMDGLRLGMHGDIGEATLALAMAQNMISETQHESVEDDNLLEAGNGELTTVSEDALLEASQAAPELTEHLPNVTGGGGSRKRWIGHHVYGRRGCIKFEVDIARARENKDRRYTIRLEAAEFTVPGEKKCNWENKIVVQLKHEELHQAAAVLMGAVTQCEFVAHGEKKNKEVLLQQQKGGIYVRVKAGARVIGVPIGVEDLFDVTLVTTRAMFMNDPDIDQKIIVDLLRLTTKVCGG